MQKILVAIDFSPSSENAIDLALQFSKNTNIHLILYHVLDPERFFTIDENGNYHTAGNDEKYKQFLIQNATDKLNKFKSQYDNGQMSAIVECGNIYQTIQAFVQKEKIDLTVIGTHSENAYEEMMLGSSKDQLIHILDCPVLTVRKKVANFNLRNIVFASNLSESDASVLPQLRALQRISHATIHLLYINTPADFYNHRRINEMKKDFLNKYPLDNCNFVIYNDFTVETGIAHFSEDIKADLVAIAAQHWSNLLDYTVSQHTSDILIDEVEIPVLTFSK